MGQKKQKTNNTSRYYSEMKLYMSVTSAQRPASEPHAAHEESSGGPSCPNGKTTILEWAVTLSLELGTPLTSQHLNPKMQGKTNLVLSYFSIQYETEGIPIASGFWTFY